MVILYIICFLLHNKTNWHVTLLYREVGGCFLKCDIPEQLIVYTDLVDIVQVWMFEFSLYLLTFSLELKGVLKVC